MGIPVHEKESIAIRSDVVVRVRRRVLVLAGEQRVPPRDRESRRRLDCRGDQRATRGRVHDALAVARPDGALPSFYGDLVPGMPDGDNPMSPRMPGAPTTT